MALQRCRLSPILVSRYLPGSTVLSTLWKMTAAGLSLSSAKISRCFKKMLQISPVQYLLKYRVMQGAEMLLANPASSISEVAAYCGFDSPSNFAKMFKRFYSCTPREYRHIGAI